jgi:hypothetical protein
MMQSQVAIKLNGTACMLWYAGPLVSTVNAQAQAVLSTMNFVQSVGFSPTGEVVHVDFVFNRTNASTGEVQENSLSVPLLTLLPIPFLRVSCLPALGVLASKVC